MKTWLSSLLAGPDQRADEMALIAICGGLSFIGLEIFAVVVRHQLFDPVAFGEGFGGAISAVALGMGLKAKCGG
ncbi:MAG: hypothetical protein B7Z78_11700 [Rhodospirillales bacterium 20-60-12]|nr:MAG: hypothetical protein B7Z78_11700 [Rhodospirillales bacterium 20-60-12]OYV62829.1 MAG: hypothetical protein B7X01_00985 [Acidiphilium sp. 21-62-4]HQT66004.1 hypothetical protein [Acetobacteraceae bacterium]HQU01955.1 hypothetical protein [Acetobacteraceae bacterium]